MFDKEKAMVCVVGIGYVGLPLAEAFSKHLRVIGYDVDCIDERAGDDIP